jgi:hypothetical protein
MTKPITPIASLFLIFASLSLVGCADKMGGTYPLTIKVMLEGEPVEDAFVSIFQQDGTGHAAVGITNASGVAAVKSTEGWEGAFPGEYDVKIAKTESAFVSATPSGNRPAGSEADDTMVASEPRSLLPEKYASISTSGLKLTHEKKKGHFEFDLKP